MTQIEIDGKSVRVWIDGHEIKMVTKLDVHVEPDEIPTIKLEYIGGGKIE